MRRRLFVVAALGAGAALLGSSSAGGQGTAPASVVGMAPDPAAIRGSLLDAAAGWRDTLEAYRAPARPRPGDTASVILVLGEAPVAAHAPDERAAAARAVTAEQDGLAEVLADLDATVTFRTRVVANTISVRVPAGKVEALAHLAEVREVVPVGFLAPAQVSTSGRHESPDEAVSRPVGVSRSPVRIALIDAGIDASHPWLGGGIGPTFPIVGGADLVDGDGDPRITADQVRIEAHGTEMAGLVLGSDALRDLEPAARPRLVAYRVVAGEPVSGRERPLARTDRVLAALERAVDPDGDGDPADHAEVILVGLASAFGGDGTDPVAEAAEVAVGLGATVVVPAGNDGPTFSRPGSVGGLASTPSAITVGGLADGAPTRSGRLEVRVGPASAALESLPLMGAAPTDRAMPVIVLRDAGGIIAGDVGSDYRDADGRSRVEGALAVVARGGATLEEKARAAESAGAAALAIWDEAGPATFPVSSGDLGVSIPVVGLGRTQGEALEGLVAGQPELRVSIDWGAPVGDVTGAPTVASFSSWGPTVDGLQKPELLAPAVALPAALPGRGADGKPRIGAMTGTSAAAAEVAARAARLRIDRPELGPRGVKSLLVQGAVPLDGVARARQGAGRVAGVAPARLRVEPAVVRARVNPSSDAARIVFTLVDITGTGGRYRAMVRDAAGHETPVGGARRVAAAGRVEIRSAVPEQAVDGDLVVRDARSGSVVATAPIAEIRPARTPADALGTPEVRVGSGLAEIMVRVGSLRRDDGRVKSVNLRSVRVQLVPAGGGSPTPVSVFGAKQNASWPAGTYRFLISRRGADGLDVPNGVYRVRVIAAGPGRTVLRTESRRFTLR